VLVQQEVFLRKNLVSNTFANPLRQLADESSFHFNAGGYLAAGTLFSFRA